MIPKHLNPPKLPPTKMDRLVVQQSGSFIKLDLGDPTGPNAWRNFCAATDFDSSEVSSLPSSWIVSPK